MQKDKKSSIWDFHPVLLGAAGAYLLMASVMVEDQDNSNMLFAGAIILLGYGVFVGKIMLKQKNDPRKEIADEIARREREMTKEYSKQR